MRFLLPVLLLFSIANFANAQQNYLAFMHGNKVLRRYFKNDFIAFQIKNKDWKKGEIMLLGKDSFTIRPQYIRFGLMGTDTFHMGTQSYALSDIYAVPKKGYLIDYIDGHFQYSRSGGHVHFYWIKSGLLMRMWGLGYAGVNLINSAIKNSFTLRDGHLAAAAAVFTLGVFLKHNYKPFIRMNSRYYLEIK
ncbi:MAG: hypothetical protein U0V75_16610 [Ferruginibacter sp.]